MDDADIIREFLIESNENLSRLDNEIVDLERRPKDADLLAKIFRTVHTIKGTCGFLGFTTLEAITHEAETILSQLRAGERPVTSELVSLILEVMDATRVILGEIEATGGEGTNPYDDLVGRLKDAIAMRDGSEAPAPLAPTPVAPAPLAPTPVAAQLLAWPKAPGLAPPQVSDSDLELAAKLAAAPAPTPSVAPKPMAPSAGLTGWPSAPKAAEPVAATPVAAEPVQEKAEQETETHLSVADSAIRVDVGLLDKLMNLVGELVLARNQILQHNSLNEDSSLNATSQRLNLITTELQEGVMKTRMQPIGVVWNKLPRVARDIAHGLGKQIRLEMDGAGTELDKTIIEAIKDPLTHIVRNCCDHGIERPEVRSRAGKAPQGRILLRAYHEGGQVNIEIIDDGAGIDVNKIKAKAVEKGILRPEQLERMHERDLMNLIFHPGFSTAEKVTNISGRGVGMDVVRSNIDKIGGLVDVSSRFGEGTTVRLKIPLTLAIIPGLVVVSGGEHFVIPQVSLLELIRLDGEGSGKQIEYVHGTPVYRRRGSLLPIAYLNEVLRLGKSGPSEAVYIVVLQAEDRQFGLVVDGINDTQEIVVKPLGKQLKGLTVYAGATIMGDGKVALILDVVGVGQRSGVLTRVREQARTDGAAKAAADQVQRLLLFRAGRFDRLAVQLSLVARLEEFRQAGVEHAGGRLVVQYRDRILPLISLSTILDPGAQETATQQDPLQVIVFQDGERSIGVVVDQIIDIVEEAVSVRQASARKGLLGSAVVGKKVADFLDLHAILRAAAEDWFAERAVAHTATVLLAEASPFSRSLLRGGLEMAGYQVVEAASAEEVLRALDQYRADAVVASSDLAPHGIQTLITDLRKKCGSERVPVLVLGDDATKHGPAGELEEYQSKYDWEAMVRSVERLTSAVSAARQAPAEVGARR